MSNCVGTLGGGIGGSFQGMKYSPHNKSHTSKKNSNHIDRSGAKWFQDSVVEAKTGWNSG